MSRPRSGSLLDGFRREDTDDLIDERLQLPYEERAAIEELEDVFSEWLDNRQPQMK